MNMRNIALAVMFLVSATAVATADQMLSQSQVQRLITGKYITFANGYNVRYETNGEFVERGVAVGQYAIYPRGLVCVSYQVGGVRCDFYRRDASGGIFYRNEFGQHFTATIRD